MQAWLLLKDQQSGLGRTVQLKPLELVSDLPDKELGNLDVHTALFNGDSAGDAAQSVARGGNVALRLMAREYRGVWNIAPLRRVGVETCEPLNASYDGRSGDLLFALVTFARLAELNGLIPGVSVDFAATGTLDLNGVVGPVGGVVEKIEAAIEQSHLPRGSIVFYPRQKLDAETRCVDETLIVRARDRGVELQGIEFIEEALAALGIDVLWWSRAQPPYRALDTYQVEHSPIFFGRDDQVSEFLERLQQAAESKRPGGLVEAASGAGKSSFVQAGLLARLRILARKTHKPVEYAVWQPRLAASSHATEIDEAALAKSVLLNWKTPDGVNSTGFSGCNALEDIHTLDSLVSRLGQTALGDRHLVWVVDQFEELFTQKYTDAVRVAFARFLAQLQTRGVWVICTLRTEFKSRFMALADEQGKTLLVEVFKNVMFPLARMPEEALGQMITEPARVAGVGFATRADGVRLDELLRKEALGANSMPLVGYALNELWLKKKLPDRPDAIGRMTPVLTFEAYKVTCGGEESGGIRRVLGIEAEKIFEKLPQKARDELPRLLDALSVPMDSEEKEAARPADLAEWEEGTPGWHLIEALREKRLLITEPATETSPAQVRVVHEELFQGWDRAREELEKSRDTRTQIKRLVARHDEWANHGEPPDELLTSVADLKLAEEVQPELERRGQLTEVLRFVDLSLAGRARKQLLVDEERQRNRRRTRVLSLLIALLALAVVAAGYNKLKARASAGAEEQSRLAAEAARQSELEMQRFAEAQQSAAELASVSERRQAALASLENSNRIARESAALLEAGDFNASLLMALYADPEGRQVSPEFAPKNGNAFARARLKAAFESMRYTRVLGNHKAAVSVVAFSPDGSQLVTAEGEMGVDEVAAIRFYDSKTFKQIRAIPGPKGGVRSLTYSPTGNLIAFGSSEGISIYNAADRKSIIVEEDPFSSAPGAMSFSDDETMLAYDLPSTQIGLLILQKDGESFEQNRTLIGGCEATSIAFVPLSDKLVAACEDRKINIWPSLKRSSLRVDPNQLATQTDFSDTISINGLEQVARDLFVFRDGKTIAGAVGRSVVVWNLESLKEVVRFTMSDPISRFFFDSDQHLIALASGNVIEVRDLQTGAATRLRGHKTGARISALAISRAGTHLVSAATDRTVRVWERYGSEIVVRLRGGAVPKKSVTFSPDGNFLSSEDDFTGGEVWDVNPNSASFGKRLSNMSKSRFPRRDSEKIAISPDGTASASVSGTRIEVSFSSGNDVAKLLLAGHESDVRSVAFSPDGTLVASASGDPENSIFIWDSRTGQLITALVGHEYSVNSVAFSPDGSRIASASSDLTLGVWDVPQFLRQTTSEQVKAACQRLKDVRAPLAFSISDISRFPFLQGKPIDPGNPKVLLSPCKV